MADVETAILVDWLRVAVRSSNVTEWERRFCASVIARSRRGGFEPTLGQLSVMRQIAEAQREAAFGEEVVDG